MCIRDRVVIVPIGLGFIVNKLFYKFTSNVKKVLPLISVTAIVMIVAAVVSANSAKILTTGLVVFLLSLLIQLLQLSLLDVYKRQTKKT